ncbi:MAG: hypothetical protein ABL966_00770 [Acidimicrobiales bacterium]
MDVVFAALVAAGFAYAVWRTRDYYFWVDDWLLIRQSGSVGGLVDHYNGHLSIVILGLYRVLIEVFGFEYAPFRLLGLLCLFSLPVAYYATTRRRLGAPLAAVLALSLLAGENVGFIAVELNHYLALLGGIACAALLDRGRRADGWLSLALAFSLASAGGGIAVAAACVVHTVVTRGPVRRWGAVLAPMVLWGAWWLARGRDYGSGVGPSGADAARIGRDVIVASFESLGLHVPILGLALMLAFLAYGASLLRRGLAHAAGWLAWTTALVVWVVGLAYSRSGLADPHAFRYQCMAIGFIVLAVVPRSPMARPSWLPGAPDRPRRTAPAVVVLVLFAGVLARGLGRESEAISELIVRSSTLNRGRVIVLGIEPEVVPDRTPLPFAMGLLRAGQVRTLLDRYGDPSFPGGDEDLVRLGVPESSSFGVQERPDCPGLDAPFFPPLAREGLHLWAPDAAVEVDVRRFGTDWVRLAEIEPGEVVRIRLPGLESAIPWEVRADGACPVPAQG